MQIVPIILFGCAAYHLITATLLIIKNKKNPVHAVGGDLRSSKPD